MADKIWVNNPPNLGRNTIDKFVITRNGDNLHRQLQGGAFSGTTWGVADAVNNIKYINLNQAIFNFYDRMYIEKITVLGELGKGYLTGVDAASNVSSLTKGFYMGEYFYSGLHDDFTDYEPYTIVRVYLPYVGYVELSVKDIYNRYIFFRLVIDFQSGQGTYFIYSDSESHNLNANRIFQTQNLGESRLIGTYSGQFGVECPITLTGAESVARDMTLSLLKTGVHVAAAVASHGASLPVSVATTSVSEQVNTVSSRNPSTNRLITSSKEVVGGYTTTKKTYGSPTSPTKEVINDCANGTAEIIGNFVTHPSHTNITSSTVALHDTQKIHIITHRAKFVPIDEDYTHIFGKPLGQIKKVSDVSGFTRFVDFHLSAPNTAIQDAPNKYVGLINVEELEMINDLMLNGVYI